MNNATRIQATSNMTGRGRARTTMQQHTQTPCACNMTGKVRARTTQSTQQSGGRKYACKQNAEQQDRKGALGKNAINATGRGMQICTQTKRQATRQEGGAHGSIQGGRRGEQYAQRNRETCEQQHKTRQSNKEHSSWANTNTELNAMVLFVGCRVDASLFVGGRVG